MPDRFLDPEAKKGRPGKPNRMLWIVIMVTLLLGGGAAAAVYFLVQSPADDNANTVNAANFQLNLNTSNTNTSANSNASQNTNNANVTNGNENGNTNTVSNQNTNTVSNQNTNSVVTNQNTNTSTNTNSANTNTTTNTNTTGTRTEPLPSTLDSDDDGLTDVEEQLYGTEATQPDTDGDGFIDGKRVNSASEIVGEVYLGYNPRGIGRLDTTGLVRSFTNTSFNYTMLYPTQWVASATDQNSRTVQFLPTNPTGETIQVIVEDNPTKLSARNYYLSLNTGVSSSDLEDVVVNGLEGVKSPTGEDVYLGKADKIYVIHYAVSQLTALNFQTTFDMMYQSFRLTSSSS
ncbi:MAG: hypothetical protein H6760_03765 [Candidatus Nomurabacteria bacterium]|nr:MAG: hypothetical protein H6760_03765 [Candidatus Nomurabacteria bacterium]